MTYFTEYFCLILAVFVLNIWGGCGNIWTANNRFLGEMIICFVYTIRIREK